MTRTATLLAIAIAATAIAIPATAQNLLTNGDLSQPPTGDFAPTGWNLVEDPVPARDPASLADFADHTTLPNDTSPDNRGLWLKPFEGNFPGFPDVLTVDVDLIQTVPGTPGLPYQLTGWARFEGGYAGGVDMLDPTAPRQGVPLTDTLFALEFLDAGNAVLPGSAVVELKANGQTNNNEWLQHALSAVAPAGTVNIQVRASMVDGEFNADIEAGGSTGQSAFFDDFSLTVVPEPATWLTCVLALALAGAVRRTR